MLYICGNMLTSGHLISVFHTPIWGGLYSREADFVLLRIMNVRAPALGWLE